eukprot:scaffold66567_cov24-Cyclotella_meneghiniana.AAC.2
MAVSLQTTAQSRPHPTNTITNVYATVSGVSSGDSAAIVVTITARLSTSVRPTLQEWVFTSGRKDRGQSGHKNSSKQPNN